MGNAVRTIRWGFATVALLGHRAADPPSWRLRYVDLHVVIYPASGQLTGNVNLTVAAAPGASTLTLDVADPLTVDSARVRGPAGAAVQGIRERGHLRFPIPAVPRAQLFHIAVWYHGRPAPRAVGFTGQTPAYRAASFGLPNSAREWWPTLDDPLEKADSADIWITAPANLVAASNGRWIGQASIHGGKETTTHWAVRHPIYPDALSFAVADYAVTRSEASLGDGTRVAVQFYAFPEDSAKAASDFGSVPAILSFYMSRLGPYPFADEKYALVEFARPSFREGQTVSHIGAALITGNHDAERVVAHEVAHQWFGNSLTVRSWEDIWLNESLSEYMAWQWIKASRGDSAYVALVTAAVAAPAPAAIVPANPADLRTMFGPATFQRGPAVLAMLEKLIGGEPFGRALRAYATRHAYGVVATADFQHACETASGMSLDTFFAHWIRGTDTLPPGLGLPTGGPL